MLSFSFLGCGTFLLIDVRFRHLLQRVNPQNTGQNFRALCGVFMYFGMGRSRECADVPLSLRYVGRREVMLRPLPWLVHRFVSGNSAITREGIENITYGQSMGRAFGGAPGCCTQAETERPCDSQRCSSPLSSPLRERHDCPNPLLYSLDLSFSDIRPATLVVIWHLALNDICHSRTLRYTRYSTFRYTTLVLSCVTWSVPSNWSSATTTETRCGSYEALFRRHP